MAYIERENIVRGNLAARNILVGQYNHLKVADFGILGINDDGEDKAQTGK